MKLIRGVIMIYKTFAIPYADDLRMNYVRSYLEDNDFIYVSDVDDADFVVLPVLTKPFMFKGLENKTVFHGLAKENIGKNYMENENYVLKNAILTAEGAVTFIEQETDYSLFSANILIIGYGRIAKALHRILKAYGSNITVCSRSNASETEALFNGAKHMFFEDLKEKSDFDFVINTVPHIVLTKAELSALNKNTVILDLASFPGGVDTLVADSLRLKQLNGRAMPSKYTSKTAGRYIGEAVLEMIKEGA